MYSSRTYLAAALLAAAFTPAPASAASFSCMELESLNGAERTICGSPSLAALDERLDSWYRRALIRAGYFEQVDEVRDEQRAWLAERDACGASHRCLRHAYKQRIRRLADYVEHV